MNANMLRCFVAIEIPDPIQGLLTAVQDALRPKIGKASWSRSGNIHLTLKFIGDIEKRCVTEIGTALQRVVSTRAPFLIDIGGIGAFPNLTRPRVLWIGLRRGASAVSALAEAVNTALAKLGYPADTRFHPHLTLARLKNHISLKPFTDSFKHYETLNGASLTVNEIALIRSELHPTGAVYTPLKTCQFEKETA